MYISSSVAAPHHKAWTGPGAACTFCLPAGGRKKTRRCSAAGTMECKGRIRNFPDPNIGVSANLSFSLEISSQPAVTSRSRVGQQAKREHVSAERHENGSTRSRAHTRQEDKNGSLVGGRSGVLLAQVSQQMFDEIQVDLLNICGSLIAAQQHSIVRRLFGFSLCLHTL